MRGGGIGSATGWEAGLWVRSVEVTSGILSSALPASNVFNLSVSDSTFSATVWRGRGREEGEGGGGGGGRRGGGRRGEGRGVGKGRLPRWISTCAVSFR